MKHPAYPKATNLCARREYASADIYAKLLKWDATPEEAKQILARLIDERYVDDKRFAHAFTREKIEFQHWGKEKVRFHLRNRSIPSEIINEALSRYDDNELLPQLIKILETKLRSTQADTPYALRTKLLRFAASRGFSFDLTLKALKQLSTSLPDEMD